MGYASLNAMKPFFSRVDDRVVGVFETLFPLVNDLVILAPFPLL